MYIINTICMYMYIMNFIVPNITSNNQSDNNPLSLQKISSAQFIKIITFHLYSVGPKEKKHSINCFIQRVNLSTEETKKTSSFYRLLLFSHEKYLSFGSTLNM